MNNLKHEQLVTYLLKGINILNFDLFVPEKPLKEIKLFNFNINVEQRVSFEEKLIFVITSVEIFNDTNEIKLGSIKVGVAFEITNFDDFLDEKTKQLILPDNIILTFNSVGISTARGVMFSQFKGTILHNAILPLIDHQQILNPTKK